MTASFLARLQPLSRRVVASPLTQLLARVFLGGLFVWSGLEKCWHFEAFMAAVHAYGVLPADWAIFYAHALPWAEILAGAYLIVGLFTRWAAGLIAAMMLSFIIAIAWVLARGGAIDCGCFVGGRQEPLTPQKLLEDIALLAMSLWLIVSPSGPWSLDRLLRRKNQTPPAV